MAIIADGTTISLNGCDFDIIDFDHSGISREAVDVSHLGTTGGKPFLFSDMYDPGELSCTVMWATTADFPPMTGAATTVTVTFSDGSTFAGSGANTGFQYSGAIGDKCTGQLTVKFSGTLTEGAGS